MRRGAGQEAHDEALGGGAGAGSGGGGKGSGASEAAAAARLTDSLLLQQRALLPRKAVARARVRIGGSPVGASCAAAGLTYRHSRRPLSPSSSCSFALSAGGAQLAT